IGPLLAWVRRNLTSHLREPYIDPTFQRQENFNRQVAKTIMELVGRETASQASLEQRIAELEKQIQNVNRSPDADSQ
nr:hypothetical protein [Caldilineaceae bacterium]